MAEFRFSLGQKRDVTDLVVNGDFASDTVWVKDAGWTISAGAARHAGAADNITQVGIFEFGKRYQVDWSIVNGTGGGGANVVPRVGDYGLAGINVDGANTHEAVCLGSEDLVFNGFSSIHIDNVSAFEMIFNDPLTNQPKNWQDISITIERDEDINGIITKFMTNLIFVGDGYDFILNELNTNGYCAEIPIKIEYRCDDNDAFIVFEQFPEGIIYINNCKFDLKKCEITTSIEDRSASTLLQKAKDIEVFIANDFFTIGRGLNDNASARTLIDMHDVSGAYPGGSYDNIEAYNVFSVFRFIILTATNLQLDVRSDFFNTAVTGFVNFSIVMGLVISRSDITLSDARDFNFSDDAAFSFKDFFEEMNKIFALELVPTMDGNEPVIKIEPKQDFLTTASGIVLNNVNHPIFEINNSEFFKTIQIGYDKDNDSDGRKGGKKRKGLQYTIDDECEGKVLNLVNDKFIQDSDLILRLMRERNVIESGTATSVLANSVVDAAATFVTNGVAIGMQVQNTVTEELALVTLVFSETRLVLSVDSFATVGDSYVVYEIPIQGKREDYYLEWFIMQVDPTALLSQKGVGNAYNDDTKASDNMTRWVENLQADATSDRDSTGEIIVKPNVALARSFTFDHPIGLAEFQQFTNFAESIAFNSPENGITTNLTAFIKTFTWKVLTGSTSWTLKTP